MNKEIIEILTKVNDFIEANKNINYKIRLLEREVPNIGELVKKLHMQNVSNNEVVVGCHTCKHNPHAPFVPEICDECNPGTFNKWQQTDC